MTLLTQPELGRISPSQVDEIPAAEMMRLVFEAIEETPWPRLAPPADENATPAVVLRTVLLFCLARRIYGSADIESGAASDPNIRYLCARSLPKFDEIRRFRRQNTELLCDTLATILYKRWRMLNGSDWSISFGPFVDEARHRLSAAIEADSAVMDV